MNFRKAQTVRLVIADDHPIFRDGLRRLLEAEADLKVLGEASDGAEAVKLARQLKPDILLIDEVFGAGDAAFAKRAIDRMMRIVQQAGIVVIATHDLNLVQAICTRVIWLNAGQVVRDADRQASYRR